MDHEPAVHEPTLMTAPGPGKEIMGKRGDAKSLRVCFRDLQQAVERNLFGDHLPDARRPEHFHGLHRRRFTKAEVKRP